MFSRLQCTRTRKVACVSVVALLFIVLLPVLREWRRDPEALKRHVPAWWTDKCRWWNDDSAPDVIFLSYPSCGRTWLRMLLGYAVAFAHPEAHVPLATILEGDFPRSVCPVRYQFIHACDEAHRHPFTLTADEAQDDRSFVDRRTVFLVRDPRDAVVSSYSEMRYRYSPNPNARDLTLEQWILSPVGGLQTAVALYNTWSQHRDLAADYHVVRYEDLLTHPHDTLRHLLAWMGLPTTYVAAAVANASFSSMRQLEDNKAVQSSKLSKYDETNDESRKVRFGVAGRYRSLLSPAVVAQVDKIVNEKLDPFWGYTAAAPSPPPLPAQQSRKEHRRQQQLIMKQQEERIRQQQERRKQRKQLLQQQLQQQQEQPQQQQAPPPPPPPPPRPTQVVRKV